MRPLVSYDDIASEAPTHESLISTNSVSGSPPTKRRKNKGGRRGGSSQHNHHDDNQGESRDPPKKKLREDHGLKEESRRLTYEEVWDDSALIRAWDAAVEEYEVLNGPDKKWKTEPVNKSPLWFNIPPEQPSKSVSPKPSFFMPSIPATIACLDQEDEPEPSDTENSHPVNFDTFVPRHDPSFPLVNGASGRVLNDATRAPRSVVPPAPTGVGGRVTQGEAFEHAMGAWYWAGYWTGVYHSTGGTGVPHTTQTHEGGGINASNVVAMDDIEQEDAVVVDELQGGEAPVEEDDLIPT